MPAVGQRVVYQHATSDYRSARITKIVSGTTVNLVAFTNGDDWYPALPGDVPSYYIGSVAQGTSVGTWQEETAVDPQVTDAIESAMADYCAVPGAGSSISLALNTARQPSTTRPVRVTVSGTWAWSLSAIGTQAGTVTLQSDSGSSPSTAIVDAPFSRGISVGVSIGDTGTMPWCLTYVVPASHYYQFATSGTGTFAITRISEQVL